MDLLDRNASIYEPVNYDLIPEHCREAMRRWIEHGILPGDFLQAVLRNDLRGAFERADDINTPRIRDYLVFLYNEAPHNCWGSPQEVKDWQDYHAAQRANKPEDRSDKRAYIEAMDDNLAY